jgi:hypothetical protein
MACRRSPSFVRSDEPTKKLFVSLVQADIAADDSSEIADRIAIALSGHQGGANEVAKLAALARNQRDGAAYFALINEAGRFSTELRVRLSHIKDLVGSALQSIGVSEVDLVEERCRSLLGRLAIVPLRLETPDEADWVALVDVLKPYSVGKTPDSGVALRDELDMLAGEFAQTAADVDANMLRRRLHAFINPMAHRSSQGWERLLLLDRDARETVPRALPASGDQSPLALERTDVRKQLAAALREAHGDLLVRGESGVGKSAAVLNAVEPSVLGEDYQALAVNLRHVPGTPLGLAEALSEPLEHVLAGLTAPRRLLVVDAAEAATEDKRDVFVHILGCARRSGVTVIAVAASEGASVVDGLMKANGADVREYAVPPLTDEEISTAAGHFRQLGRLAADPKGRELLRRPILINLLLQAGDPGVPLSDVDALEHIWNQLVRNGGRRDAGFPDAREHVALRLAAHALCQDVGGDVLAGLDPTAVAGLRDSGILSPRSALPWKRDPEFSHDLLRAYAVARELLRTGDLAGELHRVSAPRWALPAARLASELLLSLPDTAADPLEGRFARLQATFDAVAVAGHGERWADVPTEALLAIADPLPVLQNAWHMLLNNNAAGIERLLRVVNLWQQREGLFQAVIAEPVIIQLLSKGIPKRLKKEVADLISDWLTAHVVKGTPGGQPTRLALANAIADRCVETERELDRKDAEALAARAARTPEEIAADEEQQRRFAAFSGLTGRRRRRPTRRWPYEWIDEASIGHLALLGPDLGPRGETILRRIAEDAPHSLAPAVETPFAGQALAAFDIAFLIDLVEAYYVDADLDDDDGFEFGGLHDYGIRRHTGRGLRTPLAAFHRGPFLAMLRADYPRGVACLNRMLNHAARYRVRSLSDRPYATVPDADISSDYEHELSVSGAPRTYIGDGEVWLWYRGTGAGPYPCMSALQALEFVSDELVRIGVPVTRLVPFLLEGAESLAMPALALGMLARHLETAGDALDPFIVEPLVWDLEFARSMHDQSGILAAKVPGLQGLDRRTWTLREVAMMLALRAEGPRIEQLRHLGERLVAAARKQLGGDTSLAARQRLASVQGWAATLDRAAFSMMPHGNAILIEQVISPEIEAVLGEVNADIRRANDALGLVNRHSHLRDNGGRAPDMSSQAIAADLAMAQDLLQNPPSTGAGLWPDGIVATAASAVELHFDRGIDVADAELQWSAKVLLDVAVMVAENPIDAFDVSLFSQGPDRSAARGLPYLLLPSALGLRNFLNAESGISDEQVIVLNRSVATGASNEGRLAYARSLDAVWSKPCSTDLRGQCHHHVAFEVAEASFRDCILGPWNKERQERPIEHLDPPAAASLAAVGADRIIVRRLTPALRACGTAAVSPACCKRQAQEALDVLLAAHRRAMLTYEAGYHHSDSDSLIAARAALSQAVDNRDRPLLEHVDAYVSNSHMLAEALRAINAAAEEREDMAVEARRLWPILMDRVLDAVADDPRTLTNRDLGDNALAELVPNPAYHWGYLTLELRSEPVGWRDLLGWSSQIDRWLPFAAGNRNCIDSLVTAVRELQVADQLGAGLAWIEKIVHGPGDGCARTFTLPEWLRERRADLTTEEQRTKWQRIVDRLAVSGDNRIADLTD